MVGHVELFLRCHCAVGEQEEMDWSLSAGSPVEKESAGGPQPALPLFGHFPICWVLILFSPLLSLEEAELGGRAAGYRTELDNMIKCLEVWKWVRSNDAM